MIAFGQTFVSKMYSFRFDYLLIRSIRMAEFSFIFISNKKSKQIFCCCYFVVAVHFIIVFLRENAYFDAIYLVGQSNDIRLSIVITIQIEKPAHYYFLKRLPQMINCKIQFEFDVSALFFVSMPTQFNISRPCYSRLHIHWNICRRKKYIKQWIKQIDRRTQTK